MPRIISKYPYWERDAYRLAKRLAEDAELTVREKVKDEYGRRDVIYNIVLPQAFGYFVIAEDGSFDEVVGIWKIEMFDFDYDAIYGKPVRVYRWCVDGPVLTHRLSTDRPIVEEIFEATYTGRGYRSLRTIQMNLAENPIDPIFERLF